MTAASQSNNNNTERVNSDVKEQMVLYSKLFIVMGIAWIFECVHYLIHSDHTHTQELCYDTLELILRAISCFNLLRGSLIFFIFVCKDSILDKVSREAETQQTKPISLPPQVSKLTVCGVRLTFLQRKHLQHFDSVISKVIRAEWSTAVIRDHHVATPALLCHKELAQLLGALGRNTPNWVCLLLWHRGTDLGASIVRFNQ